MITKVLTVEEYVYVDSNLSPHEAIARLPEQLGHPFISDLADQLKIAEAKVEELDDDLNRQIDGLEKINLDLETLTTQLVDEIEALRKGARIIKRVTDKIDFIS